MIGVWDTGPGIPDEFRAVIFEEFRRLDDEHHAPGLGLGLAIAERMARLLGHRLVLDSRPGSGTLFGVEVPQCPATGTVARDESGGRGRQAASVLVVDNDPDMLDSLRELLSGWGFEVRGAQTVAVARRRAVEQPLDLLVLDYHLDGGHTGLELLESLRSDGVFSPVILISADHGAQLRHAARKQGCELLHKPIRPLALRSLLTRLLRAQVHDRA